jgi:oxygen-dependent protoporphyrinogen oxidase
MKAVVIGGGIAGLASAYYLQRNAGQQGLPLEITLIEREARWGGKILTERKDGFVIEGGPDTFLATKPWGIALCRELGLEERLHGTNPQQKNTYVLHQGRLQPLPDGLAMMVPTHFGSMARTPLLSLPAKARMGLDYLLPPRQDAMDESLGAFVSRRLGRSAYENLIEPLMSGIYAGDGDQLSLRATFPYLREMESQHGGLIRGALSLRQKTSKNGNHRNGSRSAFLTPRTGLAEIVESLVAALKAQGVHLCNGVGVRSIQRSGEAYQVELVNGELLSAQGVILASPAYNSAEIMEEVSPGLADELRGIPYVSTATVSLAYPAEKLFHPLNGYGYVIPRREGRRALACTWTSTKFPHRAPEGHSLVRVFIGRAGQEEQIDWNESSLLEIARQELELTLGIHAEPEYAHTFIWERAMPQYVLGHLERLGRIEAALDRLPGLALAGNGYRGIGIPDCIHSGEVAAEAILKGIMNTKTEVHKE